MESNLHLCTFEESSRFKIQWPLLNDPMVSNYIDNHSLSDPYRDIGSLLLYLPVQTT